MPAPTPSTTLHGSNVMARVVMTFVRTWARTILTEVGSEVLGRAQVIAADRAAG